MNTKTLTPVQQAIEHAKAEMNGRNTPFDKGYDKALKHFIDYLESLLPEEKKQMQQAWYNGYTTEDYSYGFTDYYTNTYNNGK